MKAKAEKIVKTIPTYIPGKPSSLPMFFENKPYQGASGRLYPLPYSDRLSDDKTDVEYDVYTLENDYIKVEVLPQAGGKILSGYDKVGTYDFIYRNEVIKPALVGLAGPLDIGAASSLTTLSTTVPQPLCRQRRSSRKPTARKRYGRVRSNRSTA